LFCFLFFVFDYTHLFYLPVVVIDHPGTSHLVKGKKKDATFVASLFEPWIQKLDPNKSCIDCVFYDGASNVQLAGRLLAVSSPQIHVMTCAALSVSLFFPTSVRNCGSFG
jgi:hypothetical protein